MWFAIYCENYSGNKIIYHKVCQRIILGFLLPAAAGKFRHGGEDAGRPLVESVRLSSELENHGISADLSRLRLEAKLSIRQARTILAM